MVFEKIFQPGKINQLRIPHRLIISAIGTFYFAENGLVTDRYLAYIKNGPREAGA